MTTAVATVSLAVTLQLVPLDPGWLAGWEAEVKAAGGLTVEALGHYRAARWTDPPPLRVAPHATARPAPAPIGPPPPNVETWRALVAAHFPAGNVDAALRVIACESRGDPNATNPTTGAAGLFQAMPQWFTGRGWSTPSPYGPFDPYDPAANVAFAAWLSHGGTTWTHWVCQP